MFWWNYVVFVVFFRFAADLVGRAFGAARWLRSKQSPSCCAINFLWIWLAEGLIESLSWAEQAYDLILLSSELGVDQSYFVFRYKKLFTQYNINANVEFIMKNIVFLSDFVWWSITCSIVLNFGFHCGSQIFIKFYLYKNLISLNSYIFSDIVWIHLFFWFSIIVWFKLMMSFKKTSKKTLISIRDFWIFENQIFTFNVDLILNLSSFFHCAIILSCFFFHFLCQFFHEIINASFKINTKKFYLFMFIQKYFNQRLFEKCGCFCFFFSYKMSKTWFKHRLCFCFFAKSELFCFLNRTCFFSNSFIFDISHFFNRLRFFLWFFHWFFDDRFFSN